MRALALLISTSIVATPLTDAPAQQRTYEGFVTKVLDGDTIKVEGRAVRIADIDAPELGAHARCPAEHALAVRAAAHLRAMLLGDVVRVRVRKLDRYYRDFAYVTWWDVDLGEHMLAQGFAKPWLDGRPKPDWCATAGGLQ